ncbi:MAG: GntR family transcriptional regulator [Phycisphaeraceae bacterium]|nr:GntR family transcriptional regulator [Phycisphaeraceae bacterium]
MDINTITLALQHLLSQPPSCVGRRLQSERALATHFGVRHYQIRKNLNDLVAQGYLVRRHGSGTFVRKVVHPVNLTTEALTIAQQIQTNDLFVNEQTHEPTPLKPALQDQTLQIAFWTDMISPSHSLIVNSIEQRIEEQGHKLCKIPVVHTKHVPVSADELHHAMHQANFDGHIIISRWAELVRMAFGKVYKPTIYLWPGNFSHRFEPLIEVDICNSIERAVEIFTQVGYQQIGLIYLDEMGRDPVLEQRAYEQAINWHGHHYQYEMLVSIEQQMVFNAVKKMVRSAKRPQAIYISSDHLTAMVVQALEELDCLPGRDIAVISIANVGKPLPEGYDWSQMIFNPQDFGRIAADAVLRVIQSAGEELCSYAHRSTWKPGMTHLVDSIPNRNTGA